MPDIRTVNHAKATLGLIFEAAGIHDVQIEAHRLEPNAVVKISTPSKRKAQTPFVPDANGAMVRKLSISEIHESMEDDRHLGNYLYLVPSRNLLKDEWERIEPIVAQIPLNRAMFFGCSFRITCEDGRVCESGQDLTEDGKKPLPAYGKNTEPPERGYIWKMNL